MSSRRQRYEASLATVSAGSPHAQGEAKDIADALMKFRDQVQDASRRYTDQRQANFFGKAHGHLNSAIVALQRMPA